MKPEEVEQVVAAFKAGASMQKLADRFGVDRTTILRRLQGLGLRTRFSKLEPDDVQVAAELYRSGWTIDELARLHHVAASTVRAYMLDAGVALRRRGRQGFK
ncbi:hypothetical protein [Amycolatopsis sp. CA-126428]|uniref:hypothetical protein n=1 Tax=Amycolatopsis sp. CA-126428 TaxID=2073158 RepID=UPI0011B07B33|nr:hypothetical protein [Amycolatopsis sp. CA-126428]